jgi:hypothetical protein
MVAMAGSSLTHHRRIIGLATESLFAGRWGCLARGLFVSLEDDVPNSVLETWSITLAVVVQAACPRQHTERLRLGGLLVSGLRTVAHHSLSNRRTPR